MFTEKLKSFFLSHLKSTLAFVLILAFIACSMTFLAEIFTNPKTYRETIRSIDEKKITVLGVSAAIAGSATLLAAVPDDSTTPLAEEMMDLSSYLVIVICVLVLEKSLLTVFGAVSCYILFPLACLLALVFIVKRNPSCLSWAIKITVLSLAFLTIIPASMKLSDYIYEVNHTSIEQKVESSTDSSENESNKNTPWYEKLWNTITNAVQNAVDSAVEKGKKALNDFTDAVAVFVIAYCIIPIFTVFLFLWLFKYLFGININVNVNALTRKRRNKKQQPQLNE